MILCCFLICQSLIYERDHHTAKMQGATTCGLAFPFSMLVSEKKTYKQLTDPVMNQIFTQSTANEKLESV